ncbi:MAG: FumA C-terminus/TtdB family hydratase beta subunit [Spirochaetes bacterium]|nr:FumA C-terminus/TtdB family hydratase beta subunit [Spirochaetota bacterium]
MKGTTIETPFKDNILKSLSIGALVKIKGIIVTARDASLKRLKEDMKKKKKLSFINETNVLYFCGPAPTPKGKVIGSCGPTTSARMEEYFEILFRSGVKGLIGKGPLSKEATSLCKKFNVVYLIVTGGAGAYLSSFVKTKDVISYKDLGPEAILKLEVDELPCIVASMKGNTIFK